MNKINSNRSMHFACGINNEKISMKKRILNIFEDSKKRNGLLMNTFIIIAVIVLGSIFIFGDKNVKQTNDSLTIYTFGKQKPNYNIIAPSGSIITLSDETFYPTLDKEIAQQMDPYFNN